MPGAEAMSARGEPADLVFRFSGGAGADGGGDVNMVFVNVRLAGVPVRGGAPSATSQGAGNRRWGNPAGTRAAGPGTG